MLSKKSVLIYSLVFMLLAAGMAEAVRKGRLIGKVVDPEGNPCLLYTSDAADDNRLV